MDEWDLTHRKLLLPLVLIDWLIDCRLLYATIAQQGYIAAISSFDTRVLNEIGDFAILLFAKILNLRNSVFKIAICNISKKSS